MEMLIENDPINKQQITEISLELGDIIEIIAPENPDIHEMTAIIHYIDESKITLIDTEKLKHYQLNVDENQLFSDETIKQVNLLSRSDEKGYARQNALLPRTWIDIHFGGEIPTTITGEITNLEEDKIEIITYPSISTIYIDFGYKGIPRDLPIETIIIREKPAGADQIVQDMNLTSEECIIEGPEATIEYIETGESIITIPESASPNENLDDVLKSKYLDAADLFGEELDAIVLEV